MSVSALTPTPCHICGSAETRPVHGLETLRGVTSDSQPWPAGARLVTCQQCGSVQKVTDSTWQEEVARIYSRYAIYYQSGGLEQAVFDQSSGSAAPRSVRLLEHLIATARLPATGRLLDIGCGNGALLRAAARFLSGWTFVGTELDDRSRSIVEAIPGVERLHVGQPSEAPGTFDMITMVHVLEHLDSPITFLERLRERLTENGLLVIEVPEFTQNPFDLLIRDHCTHFTAETLALAVPSAGFEIVTVERGWIAKELTLLARPATGRQRTLPALSAGDAVRKARQAQASVSWLEHVRQLASALAVRPPFGLFGTANAATWLASEVGTDRVAFFVDEDPGRIGRQHFERPICALRDVPESARVLVAVPDPIGSAIAERLRGARPDVETHILPSLSDS
ncbi:MAG: hypothetical protein NVSMB2_01970 [Chloroflexota bacterium]